MTVHAENMSLFRKAEVISKETNVACSLLLRIVCAEDSRHFKNTRKWKTDIFKSLIIRVCVYPRVPVQ